MIDLVHTAPATTPGSDHLLASLAQQIRASHTDCVGTFRQSLAHALRCGALLAHAKEAVPRGEWLGWLGENCNLPERTAQFYMRLHRELPDAAMAQGANLADMTIGQAMRLLGPAGAKDATADTPAATWSVPSKDEDYDPVWSILYSMCEAEEEGSKWGLGADLRAGMVARALAEFDDPTRVAKIAAEWCRAGEKAIRGFLQKHQ